MKLLKYGKPAFLAFVCWAFSIAAFSQRNLSHISMDRIDKEVRKLMEEGGIPGLSLVIIEGNRQTIRNYGYSDISRKTPVTEHTLFEIGSCSKAFTALAVVDLEEKHKLNLNDPVSTYIPWFKPTFKDKPVEITVLQLMHHTSGIPWNTISKIPQTGAQDALEQ